MALAVADLDAHDHAIERRQRSLELEPAIAAPAGRVGRVGVLDHQALVAALLRLRRRRPQLLAVDGGHRLPVAMPGTSGRPQRVEPRAALAQRQAQSGSTRAPPPGAEREHVERDVDDGHLRLHLR